MTSKQHSKIRLVKCPRCAKILPEPGYVPLYTCGGCGTTLQAKNFGGSLRATALSTHEQDVTTSNGIVHARNGGESSGSSRKSSSSGEQLPAQDKGKNQDAVENSSNCEQNVSVNSSEHTSLSKESFAKTNGHTDSKMEQFVLKDQNKRRDQEAVPSYSYSEQNGGAKSVNHTALSRGSSFIENKENGETESELDHFALKDQNEGKDRDDVKRFNKSEQNGAVNSVHHSEDSSFMEKKENVEIENEMDQLDSKDQDANDYSAQLSMENIMIKDESGHDERCNEIVVQNHHEKQIGDMNHKKERLTLEDSGALGEKDCQVHAVVRDSVEDENDQHEQKQVGYVNSAKDTSIPSGSPNSMNLGKYHVSDHQMSEETRKMHHLGEYSDQEQHNHKQVGYVITAKDTSSMIKSSTNLGEPDVSEHKVSGETRTIHGVGKPPHQDQHEQKQVGYVNSAKEASSLTVSKAIKKPTQLGSENSIECVTSDHEVFEETRKAHSVGKHSQQDVSGNEIKCLDTKNPEVENSGKGYGNGRGPHNYVGCIEEKFGSIKISSAASLSTEINQGENEESVSRTGDSSVASGSHSISAPLTATGLNISHEKSTAKVPRDPYRESNSLENVKGTSQKKIWSFKDSAVYPDSEVRSLQKEISRSSTKRSPAYDGSVSSFDGNDDQVLGQSVQIGEETLSPNSAVADYDGAEESAECNNTERRMYGNSRVQTQEERSSWLMLRQKLKSSIVEEEGPVEAYGIPPRNNRFRPSLDSFLPRVPNPRRRSSELAYETGSASSYALHDEPQIHQMHHHPCRRRIPEVPIYRETEFCPVYYDYETSGEIYDKRNYPHGTNFGRRRRAESWSQSGTLPRMPYSGEMFNGRCSCMHQHPDDRRWSAQLPPPAPAVCCHQGPYMGPIWKNSRDLYESYPTSPQRFVESESSCTWGHDTMSFPDDHRQKEQIMRRLYLREKRQAVKKPFHPIAGGAPFLTCYFCFNVLQLPEGFFRSKRRRNLKLQCGACSRILEVSLEKEGFLPPSEVDVRKHVNSAVSSSHVNHSRQSSLNSIDGRELLSRDSFGASGREPRNPAPRYSRNEERMEDSHVPAPHAVQGRESRVSWKMPARSKSPLHRLMGYSSPQDLLIGHEDDDDDVEK